MRRFEATGRRTATGVGLVTFDCADPVRVRLSEFCALVVLEFVSAELSEEAPFVSETLFVAAGLAWLFDD